MSSPVNQDELSDSSTQRVHNIPQPPPPPPSLNQKELQQQHEHQQKQQIQQQHQQQLQQPHQHPPQQQQQEAQEQDQQQPQEKADKTRFTKLSERFCSYLPPNIPNLPTMPNFQSLTTFVRRTNNETSLDAKDLSASDMESQHSQEQTTWLSKWIVTITMIGLIVSLIVLIIVLATLLSARSDVSLNEKLEKSFDSPNQVIQKWGSTDTIGFHSYVAKNIAGAMNSKVKPCDDFYQYACGKWAVHNPPPIGVKRWSNFEEMTITIWDLMQEQLETLSNKSFKISRRRKISTNSSSLLADAHPPIVNMVGTYYNTCEDENNLEELGVTPLKEIIQAMDDRYNTKLRELQPLGLFQDMLEYVHHELSVHAFFSWKVEMDNSNADKMVIELIAPKLDIIPQGTLVESNKQLLKIYKIHARTLLEIVGTYRNNDANEEADLIVDMLKEYLPISGSSLVNATNLLELNNLAPFLNWQKYFNNGFNKVGAFINKDERILSMIQDYLAQISPKVTSEIYNNGSLRLYKYLRWQVIQYYSQFLHKRARDTILPLFDSISGENTTALPTFRYRPCIKELEDRLAIPMGYLLLETVKKQLPERSSIGNMIRKIEDMAHNIRESYKTYIKSFDWLGEKAKETLLYKLDFIKILVGYPEILDDLQQLETLYEPLKFKQGQLIKNQINLLKFNQKRKMQFLRQPQTYTEWEVLSPMSLISFYVYRRNTLLIPLGGFMYPFYTYDLPEVLSYATMGLFISHEIGHSIDFVGRTRDHFGRTNSTMWDESTVSEFVERVVCRVTEYSNRYYPVDGLLTIAEVMADDGSIGTAYETIRHRLTKNEFPEPLQELMTAEDINPNQLFYLYYAQLFCVASPPGVPLKGIDHYPPHPIRVRATLANTPAFHQAFNCPRGSYMNPVRNKTCGIW